MFAPVTVVYTDGACSGNPGPGGWAWAVPGGRWASGASPRTTNQRMEITAVLEAVQALPGPLEIRSDSTYVVNCFRDRWWEGWLRRGWVNSQRKPVANRDLWEPLIERYQERRHELSFQWVKGHSDDPMNDLVDRLAVAAALSQQAASGDQPPTELGPVDDTGRRDGRIPEGHLVAVFGHRPPALGGYEENPTAEATRRRLVEILGAKRELHPDLVVLSGLQLGAEQLGAEAAIEAEVPLVAVLPYPDPDKVWPAASQRRFRRLVDGARTTVLLERKVPETKQKVAGSLARRDAWLARAADEAVLVWDGKDAALAKLHRALEDQVGDDVWVVDPSDFVS